MTAGVKKYGVKCGTLLRFWENKGWLMKLVDERRINKWKTTLPKTRQISLNEGYELTRKFFLLTQQTQQTMYKNELLPFQQKRSITESKRKIF